MSTWFILKISFGIPGVAHSIWHHPTQDIQAFIIKGTIKWKNKLTCISRLQCREHKYYTTHTDSSCEEEAKGCKLRNSIITAMIGKNWRHM